MPGRQSVSLDAAWLGVARFLEVYLEPGLEENSYELAWDQATALLNKTKEPVNPPGGDSPYGVLVSEEVLARVNSPHGTTPWWRRWFFPVFFRR
jgi:hypothetical protein